MTRTYDIEYEAMQAVTECMLYQEQQGSLPRIRVTIKRELALYEKLIILDNLGYRGIHPDQVVWWLK